MKYKVGDRIITKFTSIHIERYRYVVITVMDNIYLCQSNIAGGLFGLYPNEIELDKEYYRDIKIKEIINGL